MHTWQQVWRYAAHYLAGVCVSIILLTSAEKIVIGGGVLNRTCLFPMIRKEVQRVLGGYIQVDAITTDKINDYIVPSIHGNDTGIIGTLVLAETVYNAPEIADPQVVPLLQGPAPTTRGGGVSYAGAALVGVLAALVAHKLLPKL